MICDVVTLIWGCRSRGENSTETDRNHLYCFHIIFGIGSKIPDTKTESNIIETENGAKTNRREYGNGNLNKKTPLTDKPNSQVLTVNNSS